MLDLYNEFKLIVSVLVDHEIDYAVCGGLAMAIYGMPRATVDIDLLICSEDLEEVKSAVKGLGYTIEAVPMTFAGGAIEIRRLSKLDTDTGIVLSLDLLLVTSQILEAWNSRLVINWENGNLSVVSREGLIALKTLRGSGQDLDDIKHLREGQNES